MDANADDVLDPSQLAKHLTEETDYVSHKSQMSHNVSHKSQESPRMKSCEVPHIPGLPKVESHVIHLILGVSHVSHSASHVSHNTSQVSHG